MAIGLRMRGRSSCEPRFRPGPCQAHSRSIGIMKLELRHWLLEHLFLVVGEPPASCARQPLRQVLAAGSRQRLRGWAAVFGTCEQGGPWHDRAQRSRQSWRDGRAASSTACRLLSSRLLRPSPEMHPLWSALCGQTRVHGRLAAGQGTSPGYLRRVISYYQYRVVLCIMPKVVLHGFAGQGFRGHYLLYVVVCCLVRAAMSCGLAYKSGGPGMARCHGNSHATLNRILRVVCKWQKVYSMQQHPDMTWFAFMYAA